jgi:membrane-bound lytic murein transglycosylase D
MVRLPKGSHDAFVAAFEQLDEKDRLTFAQHKVERGDSLGKIAHAYGVTEQSILRTNGLSSHRMVRPGRMLVIPLQKTRGLAAGTDLEDGRRRHGLQGRVKAPKAAPSANYAKVAAAHAKAAAQGIDLDAQADEAAKKAGSRRAAGKAVASATAAASRPVQGAARANYRVQPGDSLWSIASKFSTTVEHLMHLNRLSRRSARSLQVGQSLAVADRRRDGDS